jgi:hypothetical protein
LNHGNLAGDIGIGHQMFREIHFFLVEKKKPRHQGIHRDDQIGNDTLIVEYIIHIRCFPVAGDVARCQINVIYIPKHKKQNSHQRYGYGKVAKGTHVFFSGSRDVTSDDTLWLCEEMPESFE